MEESDYYQQELDAMGDGEECPECGEWIRLSACPECENGVYVDGEPEDIGQPCQLCGGTGTWGLHSCPWD